MASISLNNLFHSLSELTPTQLRNFAFGITALSACSGLIALVVNNCLSKQNEVSDKSISRKNAPKKIVNLSNCKSALKVSFITMTALSIVSLFSLSIFVPIPAQTCGGYQDAKDALWKLKDQFPNGGALVKAAQDKMDWIEAAYAKYVGRELTFAQFGSFLK